MKSDLVFSTHEIQEKEGLSFSKDYPVEEILEEGFEYPGSCTVHMEFSVGEDNILAEGQLRCSIKMPCSRCLVEHEPEFEASFEELYPVTESSIDVNEEVRQNLLLNVPDRSLCRPDCRGLCPRCGKNLNEGPCKCKGPVDKGLREGANTVRVVASSKSSKGAAHAKPKT